MREYKRKNVFSLCIILAMMALMVFPVPVMAQVEEPPAGEQPAEEEAPAVEVELTPKPEIAPTVEEEEPAEEEPEPVEVELDPTPTIEPVEEESPPDEGSDETSEDESVAEAVGALSEEEIVLVDSQGEEVPLASEEAAELLSEPDPVFCPQNGVCGDSHTNMADAISDALASDADGTILVEAGTFDGFELTSFGESGSPVNITIQGGVGGTTYFDSQIFIHDNYANIILRDFTVNISGSDPGFGTNGTPVSSGADTPTILSLNNTGSLTLFNVTINNTYDTALYVGTTASNPDGHTGGDVSLVNVNADGGANTSSEYGVFIDNTAGSGDVEIRESDIHAGGNTGLKVKSNGKVKVSHTTASNSGKDGINIESYSPTTPNVVSLSHVTASNNGGRGIYIKVVDGDFVLSDVTASGNTGDGAYLETDSTAAYSSTNAVIRSEFHDNGGAGLYLRHDASHFTSMTLVNASGNSNYGLVTHPTSNGTDSYTFSTCWVNLTSNAPRNLFIEGASTANPMMFYYYMLNHENSYTYTPNPGKNWISPAVNEAWCLSNCDYDGDTVPDRDDLCPAEFGLAIDGGCPVLSCPNGTEPDGFGGCIKCKAGFAGTGGTCYQCFDGKTPNDSGTGCLPCGTGNYGEDGLCYECPAGTTSSAVSSECTPCPAGTYEVDNTCVACPGGYVSDAGSTECTACPAGTAEVDNACVACEAGYVSRRWFNRVTACAPGTYEVDNVCLDCAAGYVSGAAATECTACSAGTYESDNQCLDCAAGYVSGEAAIECTACSPGTYETDNTCVDCDPGYISGEAATECSACSPGTYETDNTCLECEKGTYNPNMGRTECKPCAPGSYADHMGATSCSLCREGFFAAGAGYEECDLCPPGQTSGVGALVCRYAGEEGGGGEGEPIPVTGGQLVELPCTQECVILQLPDGKQVEFCGLCGYSASLGEEEEGTIPFEMPEDVAMLLGLTTNIFDETGELLLEVPEGATVKVSYPLGGLSPTGLGILLWDPVGEEWVSLFDLIALVDQLEAYIDWPGTSMLVE